MQRRNKVAKIVQKAHYNYINHTIGDRLTEQPKSFFSYVTLMRTENIGIPTHRTQTKLCTTDKEKTDTLNVPFLSVYTHERNVNVSDKGQSPFPDIPDLNISTAGVEKQLLSLNPTKACRHDKLPPRLLRTVAQELTPALTSLFNQSYTTGIVPMQWKQVLVTGVFKKVSRSDPTNYRPISLTCLCCNVMEHIILSYIAKYLSVNNIRLDSQHGFYEKLSSVTQLISSCHDWTTTIQRQGKVDIVLFLDCSKAFDKDPHRRLSVKLTYYGINGSTMTWINDFLFNRVQVVSVNGSHSTCGNVTSGVPQGSVLGEALFLLYINDIKEKIQSNMRLYADDTIVY